jgi:hypothetical protein
MKATLLLADYAQAAEGKLNIIGGGWSVCGPQPTPMAVAIKIEVPWDQTNVKHPIVLELVDADGQPIELEGEGGEPVTLRIEGEVEVGRPPGVKPGTPLDAVLAINTGPIPLPPDSRFAWQLSIGGETDENWRVAFTTRPYFEPAGPQPRPS